MKNAGFLVDGLLAIASGYAGFAIVHYGFRVIRALRHKKMEGRSDIR